MSVGYLLPCVRPALVQSLHNSQPSSVVVLTSSQAQTTSKARQFHRLPQFCDHQWTSHAMTQLPFHPNSRTTSKKNRPLNKFPVSFLNKLCSRCSANMLPFAGSYEAQMCPIQALAIANFPSFSFRSLILNLIVRACIQVRQSSTDFEIRFDGSPLFWEAPASCARPGRERQRDNEHHQLHALRRFALG